MAKPSKTPSQVTAIDEEMARVEARMAELKLAKKRALEAEQDKGRPVLLAALGKVRIGAMDKDQAEAIAKAIGRHGPVRVAEMLQTA